MIGQPKLRYIIYEEIKSTSKDLEDAIKKAFKFLVEKSFLVFENEQEENEMKLFLKVHLLKSNAALIYDFDLSNGKKLVTPVCLIRSKKFMFRDLEDLYVREEYDSEMMNKLVFDVKDYNLKEIAGSLKVFEVDKGGHFSFVNESCEQICKILIRLFFEKSKL